MCEIGRRVYALAEGESNHYDVPKGSGSGLCVHSQELQISERLFSQNLAAIALGR
jgi:hypothetical protein